jgi:transcriptional regulator with XRE-family HTH domain
MDQTAEKPDRFGTAGVAIDGPKARAIREEKKLTQLYVASVVGVTTDTISRWENNRYPSIKRDNAEKLAAALEVELDEIVRQEEPEPEPVEDTPPPAPDRPRSARIAIIIAVVFALVVAAIVVSRSFTSPPAATRWLPAHAAPGEIIPVQIRIKKGETAGRGIIVREQLPAGWRLVKATPAPSAGQHEGDEVKWLIPGDDGPDTISYTVQVAPGAPAQPADFSGSIVVHVGGMTRTGTVGGSGRVAVGGWHWADANGDGRIDDNEIMPAYDLTEEMKGLGLDWKTIEAVWNGAGYRWDKTKREIVPVP